MKYVIGIILGLLLVCVMAQPCRADQWHNDFEVYCKGTATNYLRDATHKAGSISAQDMASLVNPECTKAENQLTKSDLEQKAFDVGCRAGIKVGTDTLNSQSDYQAKVKAYCTR